MDTAIARNSGLAGALDRGRVIDFFENSGYARTTAAQAARQVVRGILWNRPRVLIGPLAHVTSALVRILGSLYGPIMAALVARSVENFAIPPAAADAQQDVDTPQNTARLAAHGQTA